VKISLSPRLECCWGEGGGAFEIPFLGKLSPENSMLVFFNCSGVLVSEAGASAMTDWVAFLGVEIDVDLEIDVGRRADFFALYRDRSLGGSINFAAGTMIPGIGCSRDISTAHSWVRAMALLRWMPR